MALFDISWHYIHIYICNPLYANTWHHVRHGRHGMWHHGGWKFVALRALHLVGRGLPTQGYRVYVDGELAYDGATDPVTREWLGAIEPHQAFVQLSKQNLSEGVVWCYFHCHASLSEDEHLHARGCRRHQFQAWKQTDLNRIPLVSLLRFTLLNCTRGELADLAVAAVNDAGETLVPCKDGSKSTQAKAMSRTEPESLVIWCSQSSTLNHQMLIQQPSGSMAM